MRPDEDMQGNESSRSRLSLVTTGRRTGTDDAVPPAATEGVPSPFSAAIPDRYFETVALRDCHARVARAALDSDTVAVVEGERGCGKTTFVRMLQKRVGSSREVCFIAPRIPQGEHYLFDALRRAFGAAPEADAEALAAHLVERSRRGDGCLIVVDDGDRFTAFALLRLFQLKHAVAQAGGRLGVVVAMGAPRLGAALALPSFAPFRTRGLTRVELPHFSAQETAEYLRARIESAGLAGSVDFDATQVRRIHQASGGLPQQIKRVAGELLDGTRPRRYRSGQRRQQLARAAHTLVPVALVVVPVVVIVLLLKAIFQRPAEDAVVEQLMSTAGIEAPGTAVPVPAAPPAAASGTVERAPGARTAAPEPSSVAVEPDVPAREAPPAEPAVAAKPPPAAPEPPRAAAPAVELPVPPPATVEPVAAETAMLDGNAWLRAQDPAFYTLQLAGAEQRKDVQEFLDRYALPGKVVVVEVLRNGKVWYMVLYNSYPTWGEARRELAALPPQIHRNDPFARRFASVQAIAIAP